MFTLFQAWSMMLIFSCEKEVLSTPAFRTAILVDPKWITTKSWVHMRSLCRICSNSPVRRSPKNPSATPSATSGTCWCSQPASTKSVEGVRGGARLGISCFCQALINRQLCIKRRFNWGSKCCKPERMSWARYRESPSSHNSSMHNEANRSTSS